MNYDVAIIGAGAAGLLAAIEASKNCKVLVIDHNNEPGRKILSTGNGRCNYTNELMSSEYYYSDSNAFVDHVLTAFSNKDALCYFEDLGIHPLKLHEHYYYPSSMSAESIRDCLYTRACLNGVQFIFDTNIKLLEKVEDSFTISSKKDTYTANKVIIATGGKALPKLGADDKGMYLASKLSHTYREPKPALTALCSDSIDLPKIHGVRLMGKVTLTIDNEIAASEYGEIQFLKDKISGIPVFQLSRLVPFALDKKQTVKLSVDFLPDMSYESAEDYINKRLEKNHFDFKAALTGLFSSQIISLLCDLSNTEEDLVHNIKELSFNITATNGFDNCQVTSGGISLDEIDYNTMESKLVKGLYFAGEVIDVDGKCGGYNLQWAWSTGYIAGSSVRD